MSKRQHIIGCVAAVALMGGIAALIAVGLYLSDESRSALQMGTWSMNPAATLDPKRIMGTPQFELTLVVDPAQADQFETILERARQAARRVERNMNVYDPTSPVGRFNAAGADQAVPLPPDVVEVLTQSSVVWQKSEKAFDVTIRPVVRLWQQAGQQNRLPTPAERQGARDASRWEYINILDGAAKKSVTTASVDLGGIAKGFGIDRAAEAMIDAGAVGGLVNIGGDVRAFGHRPGDKPWRIGVRSPFDSDPASYWMVLAVGTSAVCTSGNYERFSVIDGRHCSHIIDPRTAMPVDAAPSVTVIAPTAADADAWATALSVLGAEGLSLLEETDIEAMIVLGTPEHHSFVRTEGFDRYIVVRPPGWPAAI
ncbi:MAG: hypothetical protein GVY16_06100 [Planctomycetes bacterium]|jgi:thiamine biosynthesis lipoprotein|nr:hypothetical protein [Planctomycetota bacterium]